MGVQVQRPGAVTENVMATEMEQDNIRRIRQALAGDAFDTDRQSQRLSR